MAGLAFSAEGNYIAEAGELFADDVRPCPVPISDELALRVDRIVGGVGERYTELLLQVFVDGRSPAAAGGQLQTDSRHRVLPTSAADGPLKWLQ